MKVRTIVDCQDICPNLFEGSVLQDVTERKKSYYGVFSSFMGSYHVTVPKGKCEIINEDLDCHYSGLPSPKAYDMENKQPFEFNNDTNVGFTDPFAGKPLNVGGQTKTSIDFLIEQFSSTFAEYIKVNPDWVVFSNAKAMYDNEIKEAWGDGYDEGLYDGMYK